MDKRISYKIVLDTETCPIDRDLTEVVPSNMLTYDIGWAITDKRGKLYRTRSFVVREIFLGQSDRMASAYYNEKIPLYLADIENGSRILASWYEIRQTLLSDIAEFSVKQIFAHNMRFDYGTLNATHQFITNGKYKYYFPYGLEICDTLKMSRDILNSMPTYKAFCVDNGYLTARGCPRMTAEIIYRFITRDTDFVEHHTGLEDVLIEKDIMSFCYSKHKKMRRLLWEK